jgi:hypothetical protein
MRSALHACLRRRSFCSECGEVPNRRAHRLLRCGTSFSKPLRFEPADSQCSVLDRSSPVPPGSIASNRSTFGGGEGWIKRSQDSAISSQVRFSDSLRVKCAIRSHSAAFARYSSFLFMGVFRQWLSFVNRQTCRSFQLDISDIEASGARNWKKPACGGWPRSGTTFRRVKPRLLLYPTFPATVGRLRLLGLLRDARHRPRSLRSAALEVRRLIDRFRSQQREFLSVLIVAVLARSQRHSKESRGAVAQASSMVIRSVIDSTMIDLPNLLRDGRHKSAVARLSSKRSWRPVGCRVRRRKPQQGVFKNARSRREGRLRSTVATSLRYLMAVEMLLKVVFRLVPRVLTTRMIAAAMPADRARTTRQRQKRKSRRGVGPSGLR